MVRPSSRTSTARCGRRTTASPAIHRLDLTTGQIETLRAVQGRRRGEPHNIYDVIPDSKNNAYFTDFAGETSAGSTPRPARSRSSRCRRARSAPRRGMMDAQDRLWFGEYRGNRIGMFDTKTETFQEWDAADAVVEPL